MDLPIYRQKFDLTDKKEMVVEIIFFHIDFCAIKHAVRVPSRTKSTIFC